MRLQRMIKDIFSFSLFLAIIFLSLSIVEAANDDKGLCFSVEGKSCIRNSSSAYEIALQPACKGERKELCKDYTSFRQGTKEDQRK